MVEVKRARFVELFTQDDFADMCYEYQLESGTSEFGAAKVDKELYYKLEEDGNAQLIVAKDCNRIVGFAVVLDGYHAHFSLPIAQIETLYLAKSHRATTAGISLVREAGRYARERGFKLMTASAPAMSRLNRLYERLGRLTDKDYVFDLGGAYAN